jgi:DNA-binding transcriptional MerR regulator
MAFSIGQLADRSGCTPPTIRYYESIGLLAAPLRSEAGRRSYGQADVARLAFIRRARDFGLGIPQVRDLLTAADAPASACATARPVVEDHIRALRARRAELKALEADLTAIPFDAMKGAGREPPPTARYSESFACRDGMSNDDDPCLRKCRFGRDRRLFCGLGLDEAGCECPLACARSPQSGGIRLATDPGPFRFCWPRLRGLWWGLYCSLAWLALGRRKAAT